MYKGHSTQDEGQTTTITGGIPNKPTAQRLLPNRTKSGPDRQLLPVCSKVIIIIIVEEVEGDDDRGGRGKVSLIEPAKTNVCEMVCVRKRVNDLTS